MEISFTVKDFGVVDGLQKLQVGIRNELETTLDKLALAGQTRMKDEAPKMTGILSSEIEVRRQPMHREIEPVGKNLSGQKYATFVEMGTGPGYTPNVFNIEMYFGVSRSMAWAIAKKIKESGTPANPFVERTYDWLTANLENFAGELAKNIGAYMQTSFG